MVGKGMADFSNRSFVTQDTNYGDEDSFGKCYSYKDAPLLIDAARRVEKDVVYGLVDEDMNPFTITVDEDIYTSFPSDGYTGNQEQDPFHTYLSALDLETKKYGVATFSLSDGSYLSRASMLIPRAVGYSAGILNHFFRGKISVGWKPVGASGMYDMTLTNLSNEAIGADAKVEAVFRADTVYMGDNGDGYDTGRIVKDELSVLVPGFTGLAPGQSATIHGLLPFGLKAGDSLTKFERRIAITGTLGNTPDEVIGLVQPPVSGGGVKVEVTWTPVNAGMTLRIINGDINGNGSAGIARFFSDEEQWESNVNGEGGIVDIVNPTVAGGPMSIAVLEAAPGNYYTWSIIGHIPGSSVLPTAEVSVTVDGHVVSKSTIAVPPSYTRLWQYP